jgi:hypothetical protein
LRLTELTNFSQDIEARAESESNLLRPGCSAAFSVAPSLQDEEQPVLVAELRDPKHVKDYALLAAQLRNAVRADIGIDLHAVTFLKPRTIDKTTSGKIRRKTSQARWKAKGYGKALVRTVEFETSTEPASKDQVEAKRITSDHHPPITPVEQRDSLPTQIDEAVEHFQAAALSAFQLRILGATSYSAHLGVRDGGGPPRSRSASGRSHQRRPAVFRHGI